MRIGGLGFMAQNADTRAREREVARYRRAAEEALAQLEWCVSYLHRIQKSRIAEVIDKNRLFIQSRMSGSDD